LYQFILKSTSDHQVVDFLEEKVDEKVEKRVELEYLLKRFSELRE
jgi:glutathione synthase